MTDTYEWKPPTHLDAIREAWHEFKEGVGFEAFCLSNPTFDDDPKLPEPIAWLLAPWKPLAWRFSRYNLERLFRPQKAERRQRLDDLNQYVFICGASEWDDARWAEVDALLAEFGGEIGVTFPPREWEPYSAAETVGTIMGYTREEVAGIVAKPS